MNIGKIMGFVMVLLILMGFSGINTVAAIEYPPLPLIKVTADGTTVDVTLMGEGGTDLDGYWDVVGVYIRLHFNPDAVTATSLKIDPDGWFRAFWPFGIFVITKIIDNTKGIVHVGFIGLGTREVPVNGKGRLFSVEFSGDMAAAEIYLINTLPRPKIEPWTEYKYFLIDLASFPHPERSEAPWFNSDSAVPLPHIIELPVPVAPIVIFDASTKTPEADETVKFDASGSYDPETFGEIVYYEWDFDSDGVIDAEGADAVIVETTYEERGFYKVTLTLTDNDGLTRSRSMLIAVNVLQRAYPEHYVYRVSVDEDEYNDLFVRLKNFGPESALVKAIFTTYDPRTGMKVGPRLITTDTVPSGGALPGGLYDLVVHWNPHDYGWEEGTRRRYEVWVQVFYFEIYNQRWEPTGDFFTMDEFSIIFEVVP